MKKGMIFDLYQEGQPTKRVMAINDKDVIVLENQTFIWNIDFENEVEEILIEDIFNY